MRTTRSVQLNQLNNDLMADGLISNTHCTLYTHIKTRNGHSTQISFNKFHFEFLWRGWVVGDGGQVRAARVTDLVVLGGARHVDEHLEICVLHFSPKNVK